MNLIITLLSFYILSRSEVNFLLSISDSSAQSLGDMLLQRGAGDNVRCMSGRDGQVYSWISGNDHD